MDRIYFFFIEVLTAMAVVSNIICACVFSRLKAAIFKYLAINSAVDCILILSLVVMPFINSSFYPSIDGTYWMNVYKIAVVFYFTRSLAFLSSLINMKISIDRLSFIKSKYSINHRSTTSKLQVAKVIGLFASISFCINIPEMFFVDIAETMINGSLCNCTKYEFMFITQSRLAIFCHALGMYGVNLFNICAFVVLNIILVVNIRKKFDDGTSQASKHRSQQIDLVNLNASCTMEPTETNKRATMACTNKPTISKARQMEIRQRRMKRNTAHLVGWAVFLNLTEQFFIFMANFFLILSREKAEVLNRPLAYAFHCVLLLSHSLNIFIYYAYNKQFAQGLRNLLKFYRRQNNP